MPFSKSPDPGRRRFLLRVLVGAPAFAILAAMPGCGGTDPNGTSNVMPTDPADFPENKMKASMDFAREQMKNKGKKSTTKAATK